MLKSLLSEELLSKERYFIPVESTPNDEEIKIKLEELDNIFGHTTWRFFIENKGPVYWAFQKFAKDWGLSLGLVAVFLLGYIEGIRAERKRRKRKGSLLERSGLQ